MGLFSRFLGLDVERDMLVLRLLLKNGPLTGLQLIKCSEGQLSRGKVYVRLSRLADEGVIIRNTPEGARQTYSISVKGMELLKGAA